MSLFTLGDNRTPSMSCPFPAEACLVSTQCDTLRTVVLNDKCQKTPEKPFVTHHYVCFISSGISCDHKHTRSTQDYISAASSTCSPPSKYYESSLLICLEAVSLQVWFHGHARWFCVWCGGLGRGQSWAGVFVEDDIDNLAFMLFHVIQEVFFAG